MSATQPMQGLWQAAEIDSAIAQIQRYQPTRFFGTVAACSQAQAKIKGLHGLARIGDGCWFESEKTVPVLGEVVGLDEETITVAAMEELTSITQGGKVWLDPDANLIYPSMAWRGRVIDALGEPMDKKGSLANGLQGYNLLASPPAAHERNRMGARLGLGVRAMDLFTPCCEGQRLGIFAGSGVGKSSLISMIASHSKADIIVVGLIGERGRELNDFLEETLGRKGRARSVVVAATSDKSAMLRRRAAYMTITVAEYFRDQGLKVLCLFDSVTRFAMSLREIYLAAGEPPTTKGYPPAVFAELPKLLERAGPGANEGSLTALFSVLVEGDDMNEPVSDTVRGILDGHVVMDRQLAERGHFPAVNVLRSVSRSAPGCYDDQESQVISKARKHLQAYDQMAELIELGAYKHGSNPALDQAIALHPAIAGLLQQNLKETQAQSDPFEQLANILTNAKH